MAMPTPRTHWTADMLYDLPEDGNRYEVIDGELLVTPAPTGEHQHAVAMLYSLLGPFARRSGLQVLFAPFAVRIRGPGEVQPDLVAFPRAAGERIPKLVDISLLRLVVEILSPGTERTDRHLKRRLYQSSGVAEYWIVDLDARAMERWRPGDAEPEVASQTFDWEPVRGRERLTIDVTEFFQSVFD